jgi:hypothetical protein
LKSHGQWLFDYTLTFSLLLNKEIKISHYGKFLGADNFHSFSLKEKKKNEIVSIKQLLDLEIRFVSNRRTFEWV